MPRFYAFWALANCYLWLPIWVIFLQQRGMTLGQIGVLDGVAGIVMAAAEVPTGAIADRYGRKASLVLGALLFGGAMFALTARVLSPLFVVGYFLWGSSTTLFSGADVAFLYDSLKADGRAAEHAKVAGGYLAVMQGAQGAAALLGAWLATRDMTLCFTVTGVLAFAAAGIALTLREPPHVESTARPGYWLTIRSAARIVTARPAVRYQVMFGAAATVFPFILVFLLVQPYASGVGLPLWSLGPIVLAVRGIGVVGSMAAHRVARRIEPKVVLAAAPAVVVLCQGALAAAFAPAAVALFAVASLANGVMRPVQSAVLNHAIPSAQRATILSFQALLWTTIVAVVEPALLGAAASAGLRIAIGLSAAVMAVIVAPLYVLWRRAADTAAA